MPRRFPVALPVAAALALTTLASAAVRAQNCGTSNTGYGWSAPDGAIVFSVGDPSTDKIAAVMSVVGETRSHTMLSHGLRGTASHSTMRSFDPSRDWNWPVCDQPVKPSYLTNAGPGASAVKQGAIWQSLYGGGSGPSSLTWQQSGQYVYDPYSWFHFKFAPNTLGVQATNYAWNVMPWAPINGGTSSGGFFRYLNDDSSFMEYSFFQYRAVQSYNQGFDGPAYVANGGSACSTFAAFLQKRGPNIQVSPYQYNHSKVQAVATTLWNKQYNDVLGNPLSQGLAEQCNIIGQFWVNSATLAAESANQIVNCMALNDCGNFMPNQWQSVYNDPYSEATTISPDRMAGNGPAAGPSSAGGSTESVWAASPSNTVVWNGAGNVYGCWN